MKTKTTTGEVRTFGGGRQGLWRCFAAPALALALISIACGDATSTASTSTTAVGATTVGSTTTSGSRSTEPGSCVGDAVFTFTADNSFELYLNGTGSGDLVGVGPEPGPSAAQPWKNVTTWGGVLAAGDVLYAKVTNESNAAGFAGFVEWHVNGSVMVLATDDAWQVTTDQAGSPDGSGWSAPSADPYGSTAPWEDLVPGLNNPEGMSAHWIWDGTPDTDEVLWFRLTVPPC